jgi:phage terminase Nu1 subunit (DNA packaging protein)
MSTIVNYPIVNKSGPKGPTGPQAKTLLKNMAEDVSLVARKLDRTALDLTDRLTRELNVVKSSISSLMNQLEERDAALKALLEERLSK